MKTDDQIYHIASIADWSSASDMYRGDTLESEGFIHCSRAHQVLPVADAFFAGRDDLVLLGIARARVSAEVRDENLEGGDELFPHIYGPLEVSAVVSAEPLERQGDGHFVAPPGLRAELARATGGSGGT